MQIETLYFDNENWNFEKEIFSEKSDVDLVLVFGDTDTFAQTTHYEYFKNLYPNAQIVGSSSAGNVLGTEVSESSVVATAVSFSSSSVQVNSINFEDSDDLAEVSKKLVASFDETNLKSIFIISDGLNMNGSVLAKSVNEEKPTMLITGGLAGDDARFEKTLVMSNAAPKDKSIVAIGFYGENLHVSSGCSSGWNDFGAERIITKSTANIIYEIDNKPALELYKHYLGEAAADLPGSALRYPLSIKKDENDSEVIRTVLAVDEETQSMTFAGDVPEGSIARLMKSTIDELIDGSEVAAKSIVQSNDKTALGLVVSCIGRKLVMNQLTDEELEIIEDTIGANVHLTGFYSYGELAPYSNEILNCQLHNQTMTLTVIYED